MNLHEIIQQPGDKERLLKEDILRSINVSVPGEIVFYDPATRTATIQPTIREWNSSKNPPVLLDVPVFFAGNYYYTPQKGDGCLVVCADKCIDSWMQSGGVSTPMAARFHSLSDGFAFVGFRQTGGKNLDVILTPATEEHDGLLSKEDKKKIDEGGVDDFTGATASTDGEHGLVPAPHSGDQGKFLKGDGSWGNAPEELPSVTVSDDGKVLMVVNGAWAAATIPAASGVSF